MAMSNRLTITGYSTALYATWIFVEELRLLLDAGDGVSSSLMAKSRKIDTVAVSHADRDHITGLFQLLQLNARCGAPRILYPKDSASFPAMRDFVAAFDPHVDAATWTPISPGNSLEIGKDLRLEVVPSSHIDKPGQIKSVGYKVVRTARRRKPEYEGRTSTEMAGLSRTLGPDALTEPVTSVILGYSGDTGGGEPGLWRNCPLLIHESTFLTADDAGGRDNRNGHSILPDVLQTAVDANVGALLLTHFSSRYKPAEVVEAVQRQASTIKPRFPVYVIPPGQIVRDVLGHEPVRK